MESNAPRPHGNSYWIEPGRLIAGEYPGHPDRPDARGRVARHIDAGVSFFLDLTEDWELAPYAGHLPTTHPVSGLPVMHKRMSIRDVDVPKSPAEITAILDCIDAAMAQGHVVYVHCWGGRGRTGTVVGCYFVRHGCTGSEALERLAGLWKTVDKSKIKPTSPETAQQRSFVLNWEPFRSGDLRGENCSRGDVCNNRMSAQTFKNMKTQTTHPANTVSQQFLRDIGYQAPVSAGEALAWHYQALLRRREFERSQAGIHAVPCTSEDHARVARQDHEHVLLELGLPSGTPFELKAGRSIPEPVDALLWKWVL